MSIYPLQVKSLMVSTTTTCTPAIGLDDPIAQLHSSKAFRSLLPPIDTTDLGPTALCGPCTWTYATTNQQQWYNITTEVYSEEDSIEDEIPSIIRTATDNSPWTAPATSRSAHRTTSSPSIASPEGSGRGLCDSHDRTSSASLSLEDFVVGRCLSRGSTDGSTMFLARDKRTARPLVLQCYPAPLFDGVDEAEVVPRLEHRLRAYREVSRRFRPLQVVELLDFFWDSAGLILVMERLDGNPVKDVLRQRSNHVMSEEEVKQVLRHVLEVLRGLHQHHMVHGSLRPSHVWQTDGSIVLTGMLAHLASSIFSTYGCKRPIIDYAAPEQLRSGHRGTVTPATDLWQVGVLGYELLCGCLPFEHVSERLTMEYISEGVAFYPSFLSSDAQSFLATLLCVDEADRPTADDALRHPFLQTVQSGSREACEVTPALVRPLFAHSTPPPPTEATPCTEADLSHGSRPRSTQGSHLNPGASHSVLSNSPDAVPVTSIGMPGMGGVSTQQPKNVRAHDLYPSTLWSEVTVNGKCEHQQQRLTATVSGFCSHRLPSIHQRCWAQQQQPDPLREQSECPLHGLSECT